MNRVIFNSPDGRVNDIVVNMYTVPMVGDRIDFNHAVMVVQDRRFDIRRNEWRVNVA
jgi:hypothetical protein